VITDAATIALSIFPIIVFSLLCSSPPR